VRVGGRAGGRVCVRVRVRVRVCLSVDDSRVGRNGLSAGSSGLVVS
jgi:hypothetical protein